VLSYRDNLDFGLVGDRDQIPDLWRLIEDLRAELDTLAALVPDRAGVHEGAGLQDV
jgi:diacylglycerol O-acyltransferase